MVNELLFTKQKSAQRGGRSLAIGGWLYFSALLLCFGCREEQPAPISEKARLVEILGSKTWNVTSVRVDGSATTEFDGMTLSFRETTYMATGGEPVWPADGTWSFQSADARTILRDDGVSITVVEASPEMIELSIHWSSTTFGPARTNSIEGEYVFTFE